ncbi:MAG TPA: NADH-quinone oxidoreductase subunit NuoG [Burkholderiaceae bacterium]|nr:NADH-quinone oxidoreductase subunit NuoG [Burkholderiaceae bacterium]
MVELTIDGITVEAPEGSMVIEAAHRLGVYVPHFCYHKKLTIAANCRMCLVEVEKSPKALPACATPVTNGMVVHTRSRAAVEAQKSVMEFLLINHPLDCPVCDQGGECQLQDLAVGYGASASRYTEAKRVVTVKPMGPLISADAMQRCIHCTRCVRFGQEIGGVMELAMLERGEFSEIATFVGEAVESELSGNMIDICPVGALLSKPYKMSARTWELARRRSISPHDSLGANLVVQVFRRGVARVVPYENEEVNECWISDRDRFAYDGLNHGDRLHHPHVRGKDGQWREVSWTEALQVAIDGINTVREEVGAQQIGALASSLATTEELSLLARLTRSLGSENIDFRLRHADPDVINALEGVPWLGMPIADLQKLDRVLVVGSNLRQEHPLMAQRLRQAVKTGTQVSFIESAADDPLFSVHSRLTVAPSQIPAALAQVAGAVDHARAAQDDNTAPAATDDAAAQIAASLVSGERVAVLMGNQAVTSSRATQILAQAQALAKATGATLGFLTEGGNTVGGYLARAVPANGGLSAQQMLADPLQAYIVLMAEPALDADNGALALDTLKAGGFKVALTPYRSAAQDWADVMLPVSPFTETSGTFVNAEGRAQSFKGVVPALGDTRPAWKVLRVMGNLFELQGFEEESSEAVRDAILDGNYRDQLSNRITATPAADTAAEVSETQANAGSADSLVLERLGDVPIYRVDMIVRRSQPLQETTQSALPVARLAPAHMQSLGVATGDAVRIRSREGEITLPAQEDATVAPGVLRLVAAFSETQALGSSSGEVTVERA